MTKQIEKALHNLPKTLDATYERILNNAAVEDAAHLHYIFQWLASAECPIPTKALELALSVFFVDDLSETTEPFLLRTSSLLAM